MVISEPVLTGSTHKDSKSHIQPSPKPPTRPLLPTAPSAQGNSTRAEVTQEVDPSLKLPTKAEPKSRFGPIFKKPNIGKSQESASPKLPEKKPESAEPEVVKRRELTREISNPVLISTTDRRSKHLVKLDNIQMSVLKSGEAPSQPPPVPPVPPKISLTKSDSDRAAKRNKPLPPRPVSMPVSESGEEPEIDVKEARKSMNFPQRPPPPPVKPNVTDTRQTIEQEISKLDQIKVEIPEETKSDNVKSKTSKPSAVAKTPTKKPLQPKTAVKKSTSDSAKKPAVVKKTPATQSKSDPKWTPVDKPIFKPKDKPKKTSHSPASKGGQSESSKSGALITRKPSTDSIDEEGTTSVYARKKIFEGQKKPLLGAKSTPSSTPSVPQTPPKPAGRTVKQVRSVDV